MGKVWRCLGTVPSPETDRPPGEQAELREVRQLPLRTTKGRQSVEKEIQAHWSKLFVEKHMTGRRQMRGGMGTAGGYK